MVLRGALRRKILEFKEYRERIQKEIESFRIIDNKNINILENIKDITKMNIKYSLIQPFAYANIYWDEKEKDLIYKVIEPSLENEEKEIYEKIKNNLTHYLDIDINKLKSKEEQLEYLKKKVVKIMEDLGIQLKPGQFTRIMYYIYKTFIGLDKIEPLMHDPLIEDIGCDGVGIPLYLTHKKFGNLKINITY